MGQPGLPADAVIGGWRLLRLLGQGTVGRVYEAQAAGDDSESGGERIALKLVPLPGGAQAAPAARAFLALAGVAGRLRHPGIVAVTGAGVDAAHGWLAMELVRGTDLSRHTRPPRLLALAETLWVAERLALALAHAHGQGVVHRDLKPANVLVHRPGGSVKLADFGLAHAADTLQTGTGLVPGSPGYMAPEQLAGAVPTPQSDFYALGAMLFELLAGRLPHESHSMGELLRRVASEPAPDLRGLRPDTPPPLAALVARLLAKQPAARATDGAALAVELRALQAG